MKKKFLLLTFSALLLLSFSIFQASAASLSPALDVIAHQINIDINGIVGNDIVFSKSTIKDLLDCQVLSKIKITALPNEDQGIFTLKGNKVEKGEIITSKELNKLVFSPVSKNSFDTSFSFDAFASGIEYNVTCQVHIMSNLNFSPVISQSAEVSTFGGVCCYSSLNATDPENDELTFEIVGYPEKGIIRLTDSKKGTYCYTPYKNSSGQDTFSFIAIDNHGNRSTPAKIKININKLENGVVYSDMQESPYGYAATILSKEGILTGEYINGEYLFHPDNEISKGEFLMYAMACANIPVGINKDECSAISDIDTVKGQIKSYILTGYSFGYLDGLFGESDTIKINSPITFAEGAAVINRICHYTAKAEQFVFSPSDNTPTWAYLAVNTLLSNCPDAEIPSDVMQKYITKGQFAKLMTDTVLAADSD